MLHQNLADILKSFQKLKVLVIGDVMLDAYMYGDVDRISPEAPVPILNVKSRDQRLGGAANVALNIQSLGAIPILCSVIGKDQPGNEFLDLMKSHSKLLTIILLISVISSSLVGGLGKEVTGVLGTSTPDATAKVVAMSCNITG